MGESTYKIQRKPVAVDAKFLFLYLSMSKLSAKHLASKRCSVASKVGHVDALVVICVLLFLRLNNRNKNNNNNNNNDNDYETTTDVITILCG